MSPGIDSRRHHRRPARACVSLRIGEDGARRGDRRRGQRPLRPPDPEVVANYRGILDQVPAGTPVLVLAALPVDERAQSAFRNADVRRLDQALEALWASARAAASSTPRRGWSTARATSRGEPRRRRRAPLGRGHDAYWASSTRRCSPPCRRPGPSRRSSSGPAATGEPVARAAAATAAPSAAAASPTASRRRGTATGRAAGEHRAAGPGDGQRQAGEGEDGPDQGDAVVAGQEAARRLLRACSARVRHRPPSGTCRSSPPPGR